MLVVSKTLKLISYTVKGNSCCKSQRETMEGIMSLIEETSGKTNEVTSVKQINQSTMQEFLSKIFGIFSR